MTRPWKDWTPEQWANATFCEDCGLPLLEIEDGPDHGHYICVYCTWMEDEEAIENGLRAEVRQMKRTSEMLANRVAAFQLSIQTISDLLKKSDAKPNEETPMFKITKDYLILAKLSNGYPSTVISIDFYGNPYFSIDFAIAKKFDTYPEAASYLREHDKLAGTSIVEIIVNEPG